MISERTNENREELVRTLVAAGEEDRAAFSRLYALTSAKLFGICLRICGERQGAEDVLQEVYVRIWRSAAGFDPGRSSPITWLATIARNKAIDWRRAHHRVVAPPTDDANEVSDSSPIASELLLQDEDQRLLYGCMERLGSDQRNAIRSAFYDGLTYSELAGRQGVPLGTMKSWIRRGLLSLRDCLDDGA